jgi:hypothetical protein
MTLTVDDIIAKFPTKRLPVIDGEPDYASISMMVQLLYSNAATLATTLGGGRNGHIGIIMPAALCATLSDRPYNGPPDPGAVPTHAVAANAATQETDCINHKAAQKLFEHHNNMNDALKAQIIDAVADTYLGELRNRYTGYMGVTPRDLIGHLLERYGRIMASDIANCRTKMEAPMDPTQPIDVYFQTIDDCVQFATDGQVPFMALQIVHQTAYHAISKSGLYNDACKGWRRKPVANRTWVAFKSFFATEYNDLKEQQKLNTNQNNFHGANSAIDLTTDIDYLAMAATTDREVMAQLTQTNQQLVETNKNLTEQLSQANAEVAQLKKQAAYKPKPPTTTKPALPTRGPRPPFDHAAWVLTLDPLGYCWTHGYKGVRGHNSRDCKSKLDGHQDGATRANNMQGMTHRGPKQQ